MFYRETLDKTPEPVWSESPAFRPKVQVRSIDLLTEEVGQELVPDDQWDASQRAAQNYIDGYLNWQFSSNLVNFN